MDPEFKALCRKHVPEKLKEMLDRFKELPERVQVQIIELMAGYAYGKAPQSIIGDLNATGDLVIRFVNDWREAHNTSKPK